MYLLRNFTDSGTYDLYFVPQGYNEASTRTIMEMPIGFVQQEVKQDQTTTHIEISQDGLIKPGPTGQKYADMPTAIAAIRNMTPASRSTGAALLGGDWNGSSWTQNASYPAIGSATYSSGTNLLISMLTFSIAAGENFVSGDIIIKVSLKQGWTV